MLERMLLMNSAFGVSLNVKSMYDIGARAAEKEQ